MLVPIHNQFIIPTLKKIMIIIVIDAKFFVREIMWLLILKFCYYHLNVDKPKNKVVIMIFIRVS